MRPYPDITPARSLARPLAPSRLRSIRALLALGALLAAACVATEPAAPDVDARLARFAAPCTAPAPLYLAPGTRVPDGFIVKFRNAVADPDALVSALATKYGFTPTRRYESALKGFAATLPPPVVGALRCEAGVEWIEEDQLVSSNQ